MSHLPDPNNKSLLKCVYWNSITDLVSLAVRRDIEDTSVGLAGNKGLEVHDVVVALERGLFEANGIGHIGGLDPQVVRLQFTHNTPVVAGDVVHNLVAYKNAWVIYSRPKTDRKKQILPTKVAPLPALKEPKRSTEMGPKVSWVAQAGGENWG